MDHRESESGGKLTFTCDHEDILSVLLEDKNKRADRSNLFNWVGTFWIVVRRCSVHSLGENVPVAVRIGRRKGVNRL